MKYLFLLLTIFLMAAQTFAQSEAGVMPTINFYKPLSKNNGFNLYVYDINADSKAVGFKNEQLYAELAFIQMFDTHYGGTLAYAYQVDYPGKDYRTRENRFFQEIFREDKSGKSSYKNRIRVEERFFYTPALDKLGADATNYQTRLRYLFAYTYKPSNGKGFISAYNDFFFVPKADKVFNENWFYTGYGINLKNNASIELGVLWQNYAIGGNKRGNQFLFQPTFNKKF